MADARKSLSVLHEEWVECTKCPLGERRQLVDGQFVFGEGVRRGILFIGEGPGKTEEEEGRPFVGKSGEILRGVLERLNVHEFYITNVVSCRSCSPLIDQNTNTPVTRKNFRTKQQEIVWKDEPPSFLSVAACLPRLHEEIYLVDPIVIVSLGGEATQALTGRACTITTEHGQERHISVPGASYTAVLTEKKGAWLRKVRGELVAPVEQSEVRYLLIPTLHPAYVGRKLGDKGPTSPFRQFVADIKKAVGIYERYMHEVFGGVPAAPETLSDSELEDYQQQLGEDRQYGD